MDLTTATDNELLTELQRRPALLRDAVSYAEDEDIINNVIKRGISTNEIWDESDDYGIREDAMLDMHDDFPEMDNYDPYDPHEGMDFHDG
jgi:hypothetical protein